MVNKTLTITEARKKIFTIMKDVKDHGQHYELTMEGIPEVVVMPKDDYDAWAETLEVMTDFPLLEQDIAKAQKDLKEHKTISLKELLQQDGLMYEKNYAKRKRVSSRNIKKSPKGNSKASGKR